MITDEKPLKIAEQKERTEADIQKDYAMICQDIGDIYMALHDLEGAIIEKKAKASLLKKEFMALKSTADETHPFTNQVAP